MSKGSTRQRDVRRSEARPMRGSCAEMKNEKWKMKNNEAQMMFMPSADNTSSVPSVAV
jgi:hypothetical protein